jgi:hypothetical protein
MRKAAVASIVAAIAAMGTFSLAGAEPPGSEPPRPPACPPGYVFTMTLEQALVRYAGYISDEEVRAGFANHDANGNGYICWKTQAGDRFYPIANIHDDLEEVGRG